MVSRTSTGLWNLGKRCPPRVIRTAVQGLAGRQNAEVGFRGNLLRLTRQELLPPPPPPGDSDCGWNVGVWVFLAVSSEGRRRSTDLGRGA